MYLLLFNASAVVTNVPSALINFQLLFPDAAYSFSVHRNFPEYFTKFAKSSACTSFAATNAGALTSLLYAATTLSVVKVKLVLNGTYFELLSVTFNVYRSRIV